MESPKKLCALLSLLLAGSAARAAPPEDIDLSAMLEHDGAVVLDRELLADSYDQLVKEVGSMVANKPTMPAETTGLYGWELGVYMQFVFNEARDRSGEVSPWARAHRKEDPRSYQFIPTFSARKGLPFSTEIGTNIGWVGMSSTGTVGGYGRIAVLEGFKPWPDIALQLGHAGYIGNDELNLSATDLSVTLSSTYLTGAIPGVNSARISPWANFTSLRVAAAPNLPAETVEDLGAAVYQSQNRYEGEAVPLPRLIIPRIGAGFQIVSQGVHVRIAATWSWDTIPTLSTGMGFTF